MQHPAQNMVGEIVLKFKHNMCMVDLNRMNGYSVTNVILGDTGDKPDLVIT